MNVNKVEFIYNRFYINSESYDDIVGVAYYKKFIGILLKFFGYAKKFNYIINEEHYSIYLNKKSFAHWKESKKDFFEIKKNRTKIREVGFEVKGDDSHEDEWVKNEGIPLSCDKVIESAEEKFKDYPDREKILEFIKMKLGECAYKEKIENGEIFKFAIRKGEYYPDFVLESHRESRIDQNLPLKEHEIKAEGEQFIKLLPGILQSTTYDD